MDFTGPGPLGGWMNSSSWASQPVTMSGAKLGIALFWLCVGCGVIVTIAMIRLAVNPQRGLQSRFIDTKPFDQSRGQELAFGVPPLWRLRRGRLFLKSLAFRKKIRLKAELQTRQLGLPLVEPAILLSIAMPRW